MFKMKFNIFHLARAMTSLRTLAVTFYGLIAILTVSVVAGTAHGSGYPGYSKSEVYGGGGAGDAGGGNNDRPSFEEIRRTVELLNSDYGWVLEVLREASYYDQNDQEVATLRVSPGDSPELKEFLIKMRTQIRTFQKIQIEFLDRGACPSSDGKKEASTKNCDTNAPVCMSLEYIQAMTPKATLRQSMQSLLMHEFAHQNCADEVMAKKVERYFDQPAIQNYQYTDGVAQIFNDMQSHLEIIEKGLIDGHVFNDTSMICDALKRATTHAWTLKNILEGTGFVQDDKGLLFKMNDKLLNMDFALCDKPDSKPGREFIRTELPKVKRIFDKFAQEFAKNSGMLVHDFTVHRMWDREREAMSRTPSK